MKFFHDAFAVHSVPPIVAEGKQIFLVRVSADTDQVFGEPLKHDCRVCPINQEVVDDLVAACEALHVGHVGVLVHVGHEFFLLLVVCAPHKLAEPTDGVNSGIYPAYLVHPVVAVFRDDLGAEHAGDQNYRRLHIGAEFVTGFIHRFPSRGAIAT